MSWRTVPASGPPLDLPPHPSSAGAARRFVKQHLTDTGMSDVCEVAELLVSELVTLSLLNARTHLRVEVVHGDGIVRIAVHDECRALGHRKTWPDEEPTGRGLLLIETLARDWGSERTDWGRVTWFTLGAGSGSTPKDVAATSDR